MALPQSAWIYVLSLSLSAPALSQCGPGFALDFAGSADRVHVAYDSSFPTAIFSAMAWVRAETPNTLVGTIFARGEDNTSGNSSWSLEVLNSGTFQVMIEDAQDDNYPYNSGVLIVDGAWHHVAATRDSSGTLKLYVDGSERSVVLGSAVPSANNVQDITIGCTHGMFGPPPPDEPPARFYRGAIDEVAMWSRALTAAEIQACFTDGVSSSSTDLRGLWRFDEGSGQTLLDASPAGNHGVLGDLNVSESFDPDWFANPDGMQAYCTTGLNSTGASAELVACGPLSISANALTLISKHMPPGQFGYFLMAQAQDFVPGFGGSQGTLCLGAPIVRFVAFAGQVDVGGQLKLELDLTQLPNQGQILPGQQWNFQCWFRDVNPSSTSNTSVGLALTFLP